jgi:ABC-2 type transport system permease protein
MRFDRVWEIAKKDMASVRKYRYVLYGIVGLPLLFAIVIPFATIYPMLTGDISGSLPPFIPGGMDVRQALVLGMTNMAVIMFMILPAFVPSVIASYTFVGEKINKQLEPLLATPTTDTELLVGKGLGALVPAIAVTFASFVGMTLVVDILTFPLFGYLLLPNLLSVVVLFIYCPLVALLSTSFCIFISSKVSDMRAAMQLGPVAIVPILGFYFLFLSGLLTLDWLTLLAFALILAAASIGLFALSKATFRREEILTKWK